MSSQHQLVDQLIRAFKKAGITPELVYAKLNEYYSQNGGPPGQVGITPEVQEELAKLLPKNGGTVTGPIVLEGNDGPLESVGPNAVSGSQVLEAINRIVAAKIAEAIEQEPAAPQQPIMYEAPYISTANGLYVSGVTLAGNAGRWTGPAPDPLRDPDGYQYSWYRNGTQIPGATTQTYLVTDADIGFAFTFGVRPIKAGVTTVVVQSAPRTIAGTAPQFTVPPSIVGASMAVGAVVTANPGTVAPASVKTPTYQWLRDGQTISGATGGTYTIVAADVGKQLGLRVTVGNAIGDTTAIAPPRLVPQPTADFAGALIYAVNPADLFADAYTGAQPTTYQIETHGQTFPFANAAYTNPAVAALTIQKNNGVRFNAANRLTRGVDSVDGTTPVLKFNYVAADSASGRMAIKATRAMGGSGIPRGVKVFIPMRIIIPAGFTNKPYYINLFNGEQETNDPGGLSPWLTVYLDAGTTDLRVQVRYGTNGTDSFGNAGVTVAATSDAQVLAKGAKHDLILEMRLSNNDSDAPYLKAYLNGSSTAFFDYAGKLGYTLPTILPTFALGHMPYQTPLQDSQLEFGRFGIVSDPLNQYTRADARTWVTGGSVAAPSTGQVPLANGYKIEVYGDSTAKSLRPTIGGYYSPNLASRIQTAMAGYGYTLTVVDEGRSATRLGQLIAGTDSNADPQAAHLPVAQQAAASTANIVTVNHGINDQAAGVSIAGSYKPDLTTFCNTWKAAGKTVVLITPNPTQGGANLAAYATAMREVGAATNTPVIDVHGYVSNLLGNSAVTTLMPDGVHPNEATYTNIATFIASQLNAMRVAPAPAPGTKSKAIRPFADNSPWNIRIDQIIAAGGVVQAANHPRAVVIRNSPYKLTCAGATFTIRKYIATGVEPKVTFYVADPGGGRAGTITNVPLASGWYPDPGRWNGTASDPWNIAGGGDAHLSIVEQTTTSRTYTNPEGRVINIPANTWISHDFWQARKDYANGGRYAATSYTLTLLEGAGPRVGYGIGQTGDTLFLPPPNGTNGPHQSPEVYGLGWGSQRAYGGSGLGGLIVAGEVSAPNGVIDHAGAILVDTSLLRPPTSARPPYPAYKRDNADHNGVWLNQIGVGAANGLDTGDRLTFARGTTKASLNVTSQAGSRVFDMIYNYGLIIIDQAGVSFKMQANGVDNGSESNLINAQGGELLRMHNALVPIIGGTPF